MIDLRFTFLILTLVLSSVTYAHAAPDPCKAVKSKTDAFGVVTKVAVVRLDPGGYTGISLMEQDGKQSLQVMTVAAGVSHVQVEEGQELRFAVAGKPVTLKTSKAALPVGNVNSSTAFTQWVIEADLTAEALASFAKDPIAAVQVTVGTMKMELAVKKANGKKLLAAAQCLAKSGKTTAAE